MCAQLSVATGTTEQAIRDACEPVLAEKGASIKSIALHAEEVEGVIQAYVRLAPNELPWKQDPETWPDDAEVRKLLGADVFGVSAQAAKMLRAAGLKFGDKEATVASGHHKCAPLVALKSNLSYRWGISLLRVCCLCTCVVLSWVLRVATTVRHP